MATRGLDARGGPGARLELWLVAGLTAVALALRLAHLDESLVGIEGAEPIKSII